MLFRTIENNAGNEHENSGIETGVFGVFSGEKRRRLRFDAVDGLRLVRCGKGYGGRSEKRLSFGKRRGSFQGLLCLSGTPPDPCTGNGRVKTAASFFSVMWLSLAAPPLSREAGSRERPASCHEGRKETENE